MQDLLDVISGKLPFNLPKQFVSIIIIILIG